MGSGYRRVPTMREGVQTQGDDPRSALGAQHVRGVPHTDSVQEVNTDAVDE